MTTMTEKIYAELKKRIEAANFGDIAITMKCNGDRITIRPCWYGMGNAPGFEAIEYYLVDSQMIIMYGHEDLMRVADEIANYEKLLKEADDRIEDLKKHIRKYGKDSDWDFVSDYHKDLFGHRPHVPNAQVIAWANSNSRGSARYYR